MKKYIFTHQTIEGIKIEIEATGNNHAWIKLSSMLNNQAYQKMDLQEIIIPKES